MNALKEYEVQSFQSYKYINYYEGHCTKRTKLGTRKQLPIRLKDDRIIKTRKLIQLQG